jgi:RimJ/RimL family protein N-acetyltransferase
MPYSRLSNLDIPIIETPRLRLRAHTAHDFQPACALWADEQVIRYTISKPATPEEVWSRILRYLGLWALLGYGYWVVEERATKTFVGELGLCNFHRDLDPPLGDMPEIGWTLLPAHHGKGYATEAAQACIDWARASLPGTKQLACIVHTENAGSLRVAAKCGFVPSHIATYKGSPTQILYASIA